MPTFRFTGDQPHAFPTIPDPDGNGTWLAQPGKTIELDTDPEHGLLQLVKPATTAAKTAKTKE